MLEKAKRLVEDGKDVVILLDSITRLARAHNTEAPAGGKLLSGGLDSNAMQKPKRFFGAARNVEEGGSLTILATALIDTGCAHGRRDLRGVQGHRQHGAAPRSPARRQARLAGHRHQPLRHPQGRTAVHPDEVERIRMLRRVLADMHPVEAMEMLVSRMKRTKSNAEFLTGMNL